MLEQIRHFIFDMDGVLWHGETALPSFPELFQTLDRLGYRSVFATNNASKRPEDYVAKFGRMGVTIRPEQVMTAALATAHHLAQTYVASETSVYVIGRIGLQQALRDVGFTVLARDDWQSRADIVAVGFNNESIYEDFACATIHIRQHGAKFIGCNPDTTFPSERGLVPGNGSQIAMLTAATGQEAEIIGKPYPIMFHAALAKLGDEANGQNTLMVGDRLNTDIAGAVGVGISTLLVLSGITQPEELEGSDVKPDYVLKSITELHDQVLALEARMKKSL